MNARPLKIIALVALVMAAIGRLVLVTGVSARPPKIDHKVYLAFGFHVNLYHSFRNDTNDEYGYGKDIKIIRHIIKTLDRFNAQGVPVKAVWDFDNLFSLQERLPQHAPDIIADIQRRVGKQDDEVILMSYNNGLASAMTRQELTDAMRWAISNPWGSGVKDLFGRYSPIVRPQEMMTTPGNFTIYQQQGIEAVSLYYSATPFDAFRVFARPLNQTEAYNPITYQHPQTKEQMTIIPTYHIGDLLENVSLSHWVDKLHDLQKKGKINHDVLIYINYDADSEFWRGLDLHWPLNQFPNTGGLGALIDEVRDLDYLRFTTLHDYLSDHPPVGTFFFSQDTADGSFDGYNSWAEKAGAHKYWTRIERHRRVFQMANQSLSLFDDAVFEAQTRPLLDALYLKLMRALSTTNFGMATPFLSPGREKAVAALLDDMDAHAHRIEALIRFAAQNHFRTVVFPKHLPKGSQWLDTVMMVGLTKTATQGNGRFLTIDLRNTNLNDGQLCLMKPDGTILPAEIIHQRHSSDERMVRLKLYIPEARLLDDGCYYLLSVAPAITAANSPTATVRKLENGIVELRFASDGKVEGLFINGVQKLDSGSLSPYFRYRNWIEQPGQLKIIPSNAGNGVATVQMRGSWQGPADDTLMHGEVDYTFSLVGQLPYLFVDGRVSFPLTNKNDLFKANVPDLARRTDLGWREVAPLELRFAHRATIRDPVRILKENYLGIASSYALDYFKHSADNLSLDNINNHITSAYFGMVTGNQGLAVGMDTHVLSNFAFAPVKVRYDDTQSTFSARANPFGTYHGRQYRHPTWGNRQGYDLAVLSGEQFYSAGPTYNGASISFAVMLAFFDETKIPQPVREDLNHYARAPMVLSLTQAYALDPENEKYPTTDFDVFYVDGKVYFRWKSWDPKTSHYKIYCGEHPYTYDRVFTTTQTNLMVPSFVDGKHFEKGRTYYAAVDALGIDGSVLNQSHQTTFSIATTQKHAYPPRLSLNLKLKVIWANISAYISRHMM
jgi:hypothetical protein